MPTMDIGTFKAPSIFTLTLDSHSAKGGIARIPVLNKFKQVEPSKTLSFPVL